MVVALLRSGADGTMLNEEGEEPLDVTDTYGVEGEGFFFKRECRAREQAVGKSSGRQEMASPGLSGVVSRSPRKSAACAGDHE